MRSLAADLKQVIVARLDHAPESEILSLVSNLCAQEILPALTPVRLDQHERFVVTGDVAVNDRITGLTWSRRNVASGRMNWATATEACAALDLNGFKDWRLPTIRELLTLVDYERKEPAIDTSIFECEAAYYWTSTPAAYSPADYAWLVGFDDGNSHWSGQSDDCFVRAVRSSQ